MNDQNTVKPRKRSRIGWFLIFAVISALLILFFLGWLPRLKNEKKIDALATEDHLPRVVVMQIKPNTKPIELVLPSSAQAWHFTPIWSRVNGYLIRYLVDIGDVVKAGDLLAEIDTPETDEQLAEAKADLLNSIVERDIAKITSDRWQSLWDKNQEAVTKQEVDQYNANLKSAQAIVLVNERTVARLTYEQQFKFIYAPFDGIITQRLIDIGSLIYGSVNGAPQELFQLAHTNIIRFFVDVPQTYFRQIQDGIEAEVSVLELPGKVFKGKVSRFAKALDPTARTLLTEVDVENPGGILYTGLFGRVKFLMHPESIDFIIPTTAVIVRSSAPEVAVVDQNNVVHLKQVQIGRDYGSQMEITYGLEENDRIIVIPSDRILEGVKVEVITPQTPESKQQKPSQSQSQSH
jgi:RND family efflux transporter MFP subunit